MLLTMLCSFLVLICLSVLTQLAPAVVASANESVAANETLTKLNITEGTANRTTRKQLAAITKDFTSYYLYFGERTDTIQSNGGMEIGVCFADCYKNVTHRMLSEALQNSVRRNYITRILSRNQVSWKTKDSSTSKVGNATQNANETYSQNGNGTLADPTGAANDTTTEEEEGQRNNRIHKHLIFTVLLPHHPYSQEVRKIITTVAPMFPHATTVLGNAYEFKDMTSKYMVNSYPRIMYFKTGIFIESYDGEYTPELVAAKFAEWTNTLPRAIPMPFTHTLLAERTPKHVREFDIYARGAHMRNGLSLQPLPLTAQYVVLNVTLPEWVLPYIPGVSYINNSKLIEQTAVVNAALYGAQKDHTVPDAGANATDTTALPVEGATVGVQGSADVSNTGSGPEVHATSQQCRADGNSGNSEGTCPDTTMTDSVQAPDAAVINTDGTVSSGDAPSGPAVVAASALQAPAPNTGLHTDTHTDAPTHTTLTSTGVPLLVSITVPMPNMEPFLGSVSNYAVWDTRVFLLAGLYTIVRVLHTVYKWYTAARRG